MVFPLTNHQDSKTDTESPRLHPLDRQGSTERNQNLQHMMLAQHVIPSSFLSTRKLSPTPLTRSSRRDFLIETLEMCVKLVNENDFQSLDDGDSCDTYVGHQSQRQ